MTDAAEDRIAAVLEELRAIRRLLEEQRDDMPARAPLPPRRGRQRAQARPKPSGAEVDDVTQERARRALERVGLR